jgi:hypothetical protein
MGEMRSFEKPECGGDDCDDLDAGLYPGSPMGFEINLVTSFAPADAGDAPELRDVVAALDSNGDVVMAFEGSDGLWFGRYSAGEWQLESVAPATQPRTVDPSLALFESGELVIGFAQVDMQSVPTLARYDGASFSIEAVAELGPPPAVAVAPDQTLWMALDTREGNHNILSLGPEQDGAFALTPIDEFMAPAGTRYQIDESGYHHLLWGETAQRTPPVKYSYATDVSGEFVAAELSPMCFHDRAALLLEGSDAHIAFVRPRQVEGVYYMGPGQEGAGRVIADARAAYSDKPQDRGVALALYEGIVRIAYATHDSVFLASRMTDAFASTLVEESTTSHSFASPALVAAPEGLHILYFAYTDSEAEIELKHTFLPAGGPVGCE